MVPKKVLRERSHKPEYDTKWETKKYKRLVHKPYILQN